MTPEPLITLEQLREQLAPYLPRKADGSMNPPTARTLYKWMEIHKMPYLQIGTRNHRMFRLSKVLAWLERFNRNEKVPA
jgi:hypothetical protein